MEHLKEKLKEEREGKALFYHRLSDQELLTMNALKRMDRLARRGAKIISQTCKTAFSTGFETCKTMVWAYLPADSAKLLQANFSDESLKAVMEDSTGKLEKVS